MTLRRVVLALLFGGIFLSGLVAFAPASLMGSVLERTSDGALTLARTKGSLWQGSGVALLRQKTGYQTLGNYRWHLKIFSAALLVQAGEATPMTVRYIPFAGRLYVDKLHITLPASIISIAAPQLGPYQLMGSFEARSDHLTLSNGGLDGQINVDWLHAASALSEVRPLGDYRVKLQGNGNALDAQLSTLSGKLQLDGKGSFDIANGLKFSGTAQAAPGTAKSELYELLHHIGPEIRPGVFTLALMPQPGAR